MSVKAQIAAARLPLEAASFTHLSGTAKGRDVEAAAMGAIPLPRLFVEERRPCFSGAGEGARLRGVTCAVLAMGGALSGRNWWRREKQRRFPGTVSRVPRDPLLWERNGARHMRLRMLTVLASGVNAMSQQGRGSRVTRPRDPAIRRAES